MSAEQDIKDIRKDVEELKTLLLRLQAEFIRLQLTAPTYVPQPIVNPNPWGPFTYTSNTAYLGGVATGQANSTGMLFNVRAEATV